MKQYVEFPLATGGTVLVEVAALPLEGTEPAGIVDRAHQTFEAALDKITPIAQAVMTKLQGLGDSVTEIDVGFDLKLHTELGIVLASGSVEANFRVGLKLARKKA